MAEENWERVEGLVIAAALDPEELAKELASENVIATLEWYDATPQLVGVTIAVDEDKVATITKRGRTIRPGLSVEEVAQKVAEKFSAEVRLGDVQVDNFVEPEEVAEAEAQEEAELKKVNALPIRVAEISATPSSAIPLLAAFEGVDLAELAHDDERKLLLSQIPGSRSGWAFGDAPVVRLTMQGDEFHAHFMPEDDPESVITYNWGMNELIVAGGRGWEKEPPEEVIDLVGSRDDVLAIFEAVPGVDADAAVEAMQLRGAAAVTHFVRALGLDPQVGEFLLGWLTLEQVKDAKVHHARGVSNAIGRSVDILLSERRADKELGLWDLYTEVVKSKPWLVPTVAVGEVVIALGLLIGGRRQNGVRSAGSRWATAAGVVLLIDAVADTTLARLTARKMARKSEEEDSAA